MADQLSRNYLSKKQAVEKYSFLTANILKNLLFKDVDGFRTQVAKKVGRRVFLDENALGSFFANCPSK